MFYFTDRATEKTLVLLINVTIQRIITRISSIKVSFSQAILRIFVSIQESEIKRWLD